MDAAMIYLDDHAVPRSDVILNSQRAASGLHSLGLREGDTLALLLRNDFAFLEAQMAATALGLYCVPINWHGKPEELRYVIDDSAPKVLIAHADLLAPLRGTLPASVQVLVVPAPPPIQQRYPSAAAAPQPLPGDTVWPQWLAGFEPWNGAPVRTRAAMIYTSGTTGHPKGVRRDPATPEQTASYLRMFKQVYGLQPGVRALITGPLYHASPNAYSRQALPVADVLVMASKFDAEETLALIEKHRISHAVMVPTMFVRLLKLPEEVRKRYDVSSIRWVVHTGAPCSATVKREFMEWWGPVVHETYGGTEVGSSTVATPQDAIDYPGSVGTLTESTVIAFYDEDGKRLPMGEIGEIYVRSEYYGDFTYHNNPEKRKSVERDGLISIGDVGYLKDGHLYLCDRRSDMVIIGGTNIYPAEIEKELLQCPGVQDCAVFGIPDEDMGESLVAAVQLSPGAKLSANDIQAFLRTRLGSIKVPRKIDFHEALPRQDSGKIFKRHLRDVYWQAAGRKI
ncbi:MAG: acyl-CoA synthetase [Burkholderiales bacterium]